MLEKSISEQWPMLMTFVSYLVLRMDYNNYFIYVLHLLLSDN